MKGIGPHGGDAEPFVGSALQAGRQGIRLFNQRRFFEAHEYFEYAWNASEVRETDRSFWKGLTQVAVGCCHAQRENDRGALALLERGMKHLRAFPSPHLGFDTGACIAAARNVARQVRRRGASPDLDFPEFPDPSG